MTRLLTISLSVIVAFLVACTSSPPATTVKPVPIPKEESTLTWDRNSEANLYDYVIYACWEKDCPVPLTAIGAVRQPTPGVMPEFKVYLTGKGGAFAVTARDSQGRESGLSNVVRFDRR